MRRYATMGLYEAEYLDDQKPESPKPTEPVRYQCRHVFTDGHRCGSPALRGANGSQDFCYYHHTTRLPVSHAAATSRRRRRSRFTVRVPEDRSAIQLTLGEVLQKLANNDLDPRRAGLLLYGLQIASLNLPKPNPKADPIEPVDEITDDAIHGPLAPVEEYFAPDARRKGGAYALLESLGFANSEENNGDDAQAGGTEPLSPPLTLLP